MSNRFWPVQLWTPIIDYDDYPDMAEACKECLDDCCPEPQWVHIDDYKRLLAAYNKLKETQ